MQTVSRSSGYSVSGSAFHLIVRHAVQDEFLGDPAESLLHIEALRVRLRLQIDLVRMELLSCHTDPLLHDHRAISFTACFFSRDHSSESDIFAFHATVQNTEIRFDPAVFFDPDT